MASLNMVKMCVGTGVLAVPFAANAGGLLFHIIGLAFVTMWNIYSVHRLAESRTYVEEYKLEKRHDGDNDGDERQAQEQPPENTNTLGLITWHAFGMPGLHMVDSILAMLMLGIIIAYEGKRSEHLA